MITSEALIILSFYVFGACVYFNILKKDILILRNNGFKITFFQMFLVYVLSITWITSMLLVSCLELYYQEKDKESKGL